MKNELVALLQFLIIVSLLFIVFLLEGLDHLLLRLARLGKLGNRITLLLCRLVQHSYLLVKLFYLRSK